MAHENLAAQELAAWEADVVARSAWEAACARGEKPLSLRIAYHRAAAVWQEALANSWEATLVSRPTLGVYERESHV